METRLQHLITTTDEVIAGLRSRESMNNITTPFPY
uniref:1-deoxy-D-xylulose-5-phosphate synthase n=1 Tax=Haemonchus contortus TaxID=6289 RepID=A0A7I4Z0S5_HAECO